MAEFVQHVPSEKLLLVLRGATLAWWPRRQFQCALAFLIDHCCDQSLLLFVDGSRTQLCRFVLLLNVHVGMPGVHSVALLDAAEHAR